MGVRDSGQGYGVSGFMMRGTRRYDNQSLPQVRYHNISVRIIRWQLHSNSAAHDLFVLMIMTVYIPRMYCTGLQE